MRWAIILLGLLTASCTAHRESVNRQWSEVWKERAVEYEAEIVRYEEDLSTEWDGFLEVLESNPNDVEAYSASLENLALLVFYKAEAEGRAATLAKYRDFMADERTWGIVSAWFGDQAQKLADLNDKTTARAEAFFARLSDSDESYPNWLNDAERVYQERGLVSGAADELLRLWREVQAYSDDYAAAEQADYEEQQRMAAALQSLGNSMQQYSYQQQMLYEMQRPRTCYPTGYSVTCY